MDGLTIRKIRENAGTTGLQVQLATGISASRLSQIENGLTPTEEEAVKIEKFLSEDIERRLRNLDSLLAKSSEGDISQRSMHRTSESLRAHLATKAALSVPLTMDELYNNGARKRGR